MSNQSDHSESSVRGLYKNVSPISVRFSPDSNTLRVGGCTSLHRGPTLDARTAPHPDLDEVMLSPSFRADQIDIGKAKFDRLVGGVWKGIGEVGRSQIMLNDADTCNTFRDLLRQSTENFANGLPTIQRDASKISCKLDVVATEKDFPVGTVGTLIPVDRGTVEPSVRFKWNARRELDSVDLSLPCSFQMESQGRLYAVTPKQIAWQSVADDSLHPLRDDCTQAIATMVRSPTQETIDAAVRSVVESGEFLNERDMNYNTNCFDVRSQLPNQQPNESAHCVSNWKFDVPGQPTLNVSVMPNNDLICLRRGTSASICVVTPAT